MAQVPNFIQEKLWKETYDILYDDGDKESKVTSDMIRKIDKTNPGENYKNDFVGKAIFS